MGGCGELVIRAGKTKINEVQDSLNLLQKVRGKILGIVLNQTEEDRMTKIYDYYDGKGKKTKERVS